MGENEAKPFNVFWDVGSEKYYIFAPEGCILVGGKPAEIKDADEQSNVQLDFNTTPEALWAHVTKKSGSSSGDEYEYEVEFDGQSSKSGAKWNFKVTNFGLDMNDGNQYDLATGVVNLGGGAEVDEKSLTTKAADGAAEEGKVSIKGFSTATTGHFLAKTANGVEWKSVTDKDTITTADEKSISREYTPDGSSVSSMSNIVQIKGFGRFTSSGVTYGEFEPGCSMELNEYDDSEVAFIVRTGNTDAVNANGLTYMKLSVSAVAEPFKYEETVSGSGEQETTVRKLTNCRFYFDGTLRTLDNNTTEVVLGNETELWLVGVKSNGQWGFSVGSAASQATGAINVKLYEISNETWRPTIDYRAGYISVGTGQVSVDEASIDKVPASSGAEPTGEVEVKGFSGASAWQMPYKNDQGGLVWGGKMITSVASSNSSATFAFADGSSVVIQNGTNGKDAGITVSSSEIDGSSDHPAGGVELKFQPTQDSSAHGSSTVVEIWNGSNAELSDDDPEDCVVSGCGACAGGSDEAARADHVHELPSVVVHDGRLNDLKLGAGVGPAVTLGKIVASTAVTITQKTLVEGTNITLTESGSSITISATATASSVTPGAGIKIDSSAVAFNADGLSLETATGTGNERVARLRGVDNPQASGNQSAYTIGGALTTGCTSGVMAVVVENSGGDWGVRYAPIGAVAVDAATNSGLQFSTATVSGTTYKRLDWTGRGSNDQISLRNLKVYNSSGVAGTTVKIPSTADVDVPGIKGGLGVTVSNDDSGNTRRIDANIADVTSDLGSGISVSKDSSNVVRISLTGAGSDSSSYYNDSTTGIRVCTGMSYDQTTHQFTAQYMTLLFSGGRVLANPASSSTAVFTAVLET